MSTPAAKRERLALPGTGPTDQDLRTEVELTREELGETVAALMYKADVKSRMREAAQRRMALLHDALDAATDRTHELVRSARRHPVAVSAGATTVLAAVLLLIRNN